MASFLTPRAEVAGKQICKHKQQQKKELRAAQPNFIQLQSTFPKTSVQSKKKSEFNPGQGSSIQFNSIQSSIEPWEIQKNNEGQSNGKTIENVICLLPCPQGNNERLNENQKWAHYRPASQQGPRKNGVKTMICFMNVIWKEKRNTSQAKGKKCTAKTLKSLHKRDFILLTQFK